MRGNWTSRTRQDLSFASRKSMNCSAHANVSTFNPTDSNKLPKAFRIASSSSTIDTKKGLERVRVMAKIFSAAFMKAEGYCRNGGAVHYLVGRRTNTFGKGSPTFRPCAPDPARIEPASCA